MGVAAIGRDDPAITISEGLAKKLSSARSMKAAAAGKVAEDDKVEALMSSHAGVVDAYRRAFVEVGLQQRSIRRKEFVLARRLGIVALDGRASTFGDYALRCRILFQI